MTIATTCLTADEVIYWNSNPSVKSGALKRPLLTRDHFNTAHNHRKAKSVSLTSKKQIMQICTYSREWVFINKGVKSSLGGP